MQDDNEVWISDALPIIPGNGLVVYELGPEVKEPDYAPLVEWLRGSEGYARLPHQKIQCAEPPCVCGLTDALKAAGL